MTSGTSVDSGEIAAAFAGSGCRSVCLTSSDMLYEQHATAVTAALRAAGAARIWLAGSFSAGTDGLLRAGCDALDVLHKTYQDLGLADG
ncbi:hypothetical protein QLQ12_32450 [Actinoplanes sp. NEAU-A12]|uniref:Uncharacterized protein n=1 Tax=Actinoplanes sandaracinus TaxID=3045177 RepID=A0ABT6WUA8_9ACTN|nr:hypothetical protein [Actinoplanes sandaracinus]MDI6103330.1 hypothetical protein [Actinoplanes sandaracinus]